MKPIVFVLVLGLSMFSCKTDHKQFYAIRDFRKELQPYLSEIVTKGYVDYDDATDYVQKKATTAELERLLRSEHPLLRAVACRALIKRPGVDHFDVIMHHLDDTALISVQRGEWGLRYRMVSDDMIYNARWKSEQDRQKTTDSIILRHHYLWTAYDALARIKPEAKYYTSIKEMALKDMPNIQRSAALYALARYRKKEDVSLIKDALEGNKGLLAESVDLMGDFPDTAYIPLLQYYFRRQLVRSICHDDVWNPQVPFFKAVAVYKNDSSRKILDTLLHHKPIMPCYCDTADIRDQIITAIWNNPCPAYADLRKEITDYMIKKERSQWDRERAAGLLSGPDSSIYFIPRDTSAEQVRWF